MPYMPGWGAPNDPGRVNNPFEGIQLPDFGKVFTPQYLPAMAIAFSSGLGAMGQILGGNAMVTAAKRRREAADFEARQLEINAGQAKAASQRQAYFQNLEGEQLISAIRARAGAGGTDPTVMNIIGRALERQAYNVKAAFYGGEDKARTMQIQAASKRYEGELGVEDARAGRRAAYLAAGGTLAAGGASIYQKYWPKDMNTPLVPEAVPGQYSLVNPQYG